MYNIYIRRKGTAALLFFLSPVRTFTFFCLRGEIYWKLTHQVVTLTSLSLFFGECRLRVTSHRAAVVNVF